MNEGIENMLIHIGTMQIETKRLVLRKFYYIHDENMLKYWISHSAVQSKFIQQNRRLKGSLINT